MDEFGFDRFLFFRKARRCCPRLIGGVLRIGVPQKGWFPLGCLSNTEQQTSHFVRSEAGPCSLSRAGSRLLCRLTEKIHRALCQRDLSRGGSPFRCVNSWTFTHMSGFILVFLYGEQGSNRVQQVLTALWTVQRIHGSSALRQLRLSAASIAGRCSFDCPARHCDPQIEQMSHHMQKTHVSS